MNLALALSLLGTLLPLGVLLVLRARRDRALWEIALDLPLATAADLLVILVLSRFYRLELAILVSRVLWLMLGLAWALWRGHHRAIAWPRALGWRPLLAVLCAVAVAVILSMQISRPCLNADRHWHIPLVASLRGQRLPFMNVLDPKGALTYHFAGDVHAVVLQVLSGDVFHASYALSLSHDLLFALLGATVALLLLDAGLRHVTPVVLGVLALLLAAPLTLFRTDWVSAGYSFVNFYRVSFRPHASLGALLVVGFFAAVAVRVREGPGTVPWHRTAPALLACTGLLAVTDEASLGVLGLGLGAAWLVDREVLAHRRWQGVLWLAALVVVIVGVSIIAAGTLAPGAPPHAITLVPWRSPGYRNDPLPLSDPKGRWLLIHDVGALALVALAGALTYLRTRSRMVRATWVFLTIVLGASVLALTRIDVDELPIENHRFMTAVMLLAPLCAALWLVRRKEPTRPRAMGSLSAGALVLAMGLPAATTVVWIRAVAPGKCDKPSEIFATQDFNQTNCRTELGTRRHERALPTYVSRSVYYLYTGCDPTFVPANHASGKHWTLKVGRVKLGYDELGELHAHMVGRNDPLRVICPVDGEPDPICDAARDNGSCVARGTQIVSCLLSGQERAALLKTRPH